MEDSASLLKSEPVENVQPERKFNIKLLIPVFLLLILIILGGVYWMNFGSSNPASPTAEKTASLIKSEVITPSPSPSPFLFEELTIPYLRNFNYESNLGERERYADGGNFTSYLTSYTSQGLKINGFLTEPKGEMPEGGWPAIVFIHGYIPPETYRTTEKYIDHVNTLARNGFVVFKIDLRGHGDSEGEPGGGYYSSDYVIDALSAYTALQKSGFVNPDKIGFWGHSMAGNVVLRIMAAKPEIPAASVWAGAGFTYLDLNQYGIQDGSYQPPANATARQRRRQLLRQTYGEPKDGNPFWKLVAPTDYLPEVKGAIQLNHAVNDDVVNIGYSRNLNQILDKTSVIHELNEFPSGGHNITNPSFTPAMQKTIEFFKKYLAS